MKRPLAIVPAYNEADIIGPVIRHLKAQGCDVCVLDNWSSDDTKRVASSAGVDELQSWPWRPPDIYDWTGLLTRIEEIALEYGAGRWVMLNDADEIRRAPHGTLAEAMEQASAAGYNALNFSVRHFVPIDETFQDGSDPEAHFRYFREQHVDARLPHIKAWFQGEQQVDLHSTGGHHVMFRGQRIAPEPLLLKHYPVRSEAHGRRKVFGERLPRYSAAEKAKQWHVQYDAHAAGLPFTGDLAQLQRDQREVAIVTLTRFPEIFERFAASVERHEPGRRKIVVTSGGCHIQRPGWEVLPGVEPFVFARNLNLAIAAAPECDVFACNDDVELAAPVVEELQAVFATGRNGLVTPKIEGDGINLPLAWASEPARERFALCRDYVPFVSVLLNRDMLRTVGPLEESFTGYGGEDVEFGTRMHRAGWASWVAGRACVRHGFGEHRYSSSFLRVMSAQERTASMVEMNARVATLTAR